MSQTVQQTPLEKKAIRGAYITAIGDVFQEGDKAVEYESDGLMIIEQGHIKHIGPYEKIKQYLSDDLPVEHNKDTLMMPGMVDSHVHYPQMQMIGAYGDQLLEWLNEYTFPTESKFKDKAHSQLVAKAFFKELLRGGTTTASVYCTVHPNSVDAFFEQSQRYGTRMIAGKVMMNRNAPEHLLDTVETSLADSEALIQKWHNNGRNLYSVTPRFAPSSTDEQLKAAGDLFQRYTGQGVYMQTHLAENLHEIAWVKSLFPDRVDYLDVYDHFGLIGPRSVFGHCIHLNTHNVQHLATTGSAIAHCPTSNLFLGSGLMALKQMKKTTDNHIRIGIGTDLGAGTAFCQLTTLNEVYKISELVGHKVNAFEAFYLATRGGAESLYLADKIGSLIPGNEADFLVLDLKATELLDFRLQFAKNLQELLFSLIILGSSQLVQSTYVGGQKVFDKNTNQFYQKN